MESKTSNECLHVITWNINGASLSLGPIEKLLKDQTPDVLCLQELHVKANSEKAKQLQTAWKHAFPDYEAWFAFNEKAYWHGVATLVHKKHAATKCLHQDPFVDHPKEGRIVTVQLASWPAPIMNVYVPNSGVGKTPLKRLDYRVSKWDPTLRTFVYNLIMSHSDSVILCGDMNVVHRLNENDVSPYANDIHYKRVTPSMSRKAGLTDEERASFRQLLKRCYLHDAYRVKHPKEGLGAYTFFGGRQPPENRTKGWRLDYQLYRSPHFHVQDARVLTAWPGSDHVPLCVTYRKHVSDERQPLPYEGKSHSQETKGL